MASVTGKDTTKVGRKFKALHTISNKFGQLRKKGSKTVKTLEELKPQLDETLEFLNKCTDYNSTEVSDILEYISEISEISDKSLCKEVGSHLAEKHYCRLFVRIATNLQECRRGSQVVDDQQWCSNLIKLESAYANFAYECPELGKEMGREGGAKLLFNDLKEIRLCVDDPTTKWACDIATAVLGVLHSCFYANAENREIYKNADAVDILVSYLQSNDMGVKITSLSLLLYVEGELRSELVTENRQCIVYLTQLLKQAVNSRDHTTTVGKSRFSARELLNCLNHLAINDEYKEEIQKHGGVSSITKMLQPEFSEEEQRVGAEGLWNMAFVESGIKSSVKDITKSLKCLKKSANKTLREASTFALWELEGRLCDASKLGHRTDESSEEETKPTKSKSTASHVMISYQWSSQKRVLNIRDKLIKAGYNVWMDVDKMKGNILTAMAEAVEEAAVVVVCMTRKYKESLNCRSEASYAYKHAKPIVPVLLEEGYKPDGWLGLFVGMQLYYELFSDVSMDKNMQALIADIGKGGSSAAANETASQGLSKSEQLPHNKNTQSNFTETEQIRDRQNQPAIQEWSIERVQVWFKENGLPELCSILDFCDGKHLQDMYNRYSQSPESFRNDLKSDLHLSFTISVKFTTALDKLFKV